MVIDTNVLISGLRGGFGGRRIREAWKQGRIHLLVSQEILDEYYAVLARVARSEDLGEFLLLFSSPRKTTLIVPEKRFQAIPEDPADNMFLDCAVAGGAECIVSADWHLLKLKAFHGIPIFSPRRFLRRF